MQQISRVNTDVDVSKSTTKVTRKDAQKKIGKTLFSICCLSIVSFCAGFSTSLSAASVKVAFLGDQGIDENAQAVLSLVANENADLLLIPGDLGYEPLAAIVWEKNLNSILGENFPVLVAAGNHENFEWPLYKNFIQQRIDRIEGLTCNGDTGVKSLCQFENIDIVLVSPGITEIDGVLPDDNYPDFIRQSLANSGNHWRICSWHKNQSALQTGAKGDATGWEVYDACIDNAAFVALAHEHAYSRTHLLSNFSTQSIVHKNSDMTVKPGQSFAFVSGLGGKSIRPQIKLGDWWASVYTATQGATYGALFCTFEESTADCYFKGIDGSVPDQFTLTLDTGNTDSPQPPANPPANPPETPSIPDAGFVFSRSDITENWWISVDDSGQLASVWIDQECATKLTSEPNNGILETGDWFDLIDHTSKFGGITAPCKEEPSLEVEDPNPENPSNPNVGPDIEPNVDPNADLDPGFLFSRTDADEVRWISQDTSGQLASVWVDSDCVTRINAALPEQPMRTGNWFDLITLAPGFDTIKPPCGPELDQNARAGQVYSRTDVEEYRWLQQSASGDIGSVWISKECAERLGGATIEGGWFDLITLAPAFDSISTPCPVADPNQSGFVFSRSDVAEYRWIDTTENGQLGSVWIDPECVNQLGGVKQTGGWFELQELAPLFDGITSPCKF